MLLNNMGVPFGRRLAVVRVKHLSEFGIVRNIYRYRETRDWLLGAYLWTSHELCMFCKTNVALTAIANLSNVKINSGSTAVHPQHHR
jgi:hypothetical protein